MEVHTIRRILVIMPKQRLWHKCRMEDTAFHKAMLLHIQIHIDGFWRISGDCDPHGCAFIPFVL